MTRIAIVGGGITGLATKALVNNANVVLYEASNRLGGILKDYKIDKSSFFTSCQYFSGESSWFERMDLFSDFYEFSHTYGSYTDIFGSETLSNNFAGPTYSGNSLRFSQAEQPLPKKLIERLSLYPEVIENGLRKWFQFIGIDADVTHQSAIVGFQASRVYIAGHEEEIKNIKNESPVADLIYGLPRNTIDLPNIRSFLPYHGFDSIFSKITEKSSSQYFSLGHPVKPIISKGKLSLKIKNELTSPDFVIWTSNPSPLIKVVTGKKLDSQKFKAEIVVGMLDKVVSAPFYIQVFSIQSRVLRIFIYNINGKGCFTIEKARDEQTCEEVIHFSQGIMSKFISNQIVSVVGRKREVRYFAYTVRDHEILDGFQNQREIENLIIPDYLAYGRDQKIESIMHQICTRNL